MKAFQSKEAVGTVDYLPGVFETHAGYLARVGANLTTRQMLLFRQDSQH